MSSRFADMRGSTASPHVHLQQTCAQLTAYTSMMPRTMKVCSTCGLLQGQAGTCFLCNQGFSSAHRKDHEPGLRSTSIPIAPAKPCPRMPCALATSLGMSRAPARPAQPRRSQAHALHQPWSLSALPAPCGRPRCAWRPLPPRCAPRCARARRSASRLWGVQMSSSRAGSRLSRASRGCRDHSSWPPSASSCCPPRSSRAQAPSPPSLALGCLAGSGGFAAGISWEGALPSPPCPPPSSAAGCSGRKASRRAANHSRARRRGTRCSSQMLSSTASSGKRACAARAAGRGPLPA